MIIFKIYTSKKVQNKQTAPKKFFFSKLYSWIFSSSTSTKPSKTFKQHQRIISTMNPRFFFGKKLHSGKVSSIIKVKFLFFGIKESLEIIQNRFLQEEIQNQETHYQGKYKIFGSLFNDNSFFFVNGRTSLEIRGKSNP